MAFRQEQVSVRQGLFDVRLHRGGAGAPLVYLHGAGGQAAIDPFLEALAEEREVIVPIHPGWPGSEGLDHIDDAVDMAIYYLDLFDALGLEQVDLIGASLGGMFAAEIAAIGGSYVRRLGLCEPAGLWLDEHVPLDFFAAGQEQLSRAVFYDADLAARRAAAAAEADDPARAGLDRTQALAAASKFLWPIWDKGLKKRLHRIKAPTLIVWGRHDGLIPPVYADEFRRRIPGSRLVMFEHSAHVPMIEEPDLFVSTVRDFLNS